MPKRVKQRIIAKSGDVSEIAYQLVDLSTRRMDNGTPESRSIPKAVSRYMAEIGRKGGQIGGKQRLNTMSSEERRKVAQKAARARWAATEDELDSKN